jgi:hypothetical protein
MATSLPTQPTTDALTDYPVADPRVVHPRDKAELGGSDNITSSPGTTAAPNAHPMLDADAGALGIVGPVSGAQEMPNAAKPGTP